MASASDTAGGTAGDAAADIAGDAAPKVLSAADFREKAKALPLRIEQVAVPDLGGVIYVRQLSALEKDRLDDSLTDDKGKPVTDNVRAKVFAACACDSGGKSLFALAPVDVAEIGGWPNSVVDPVYEAAMRVNRLRASDRAAEKKDSAGATAAGSP